MRKNIVIGIDGVPYELMALYMEEGLLPNLKKLAEKGTFQKTISSTPEVSSVAWSTIMTGANPGEHGIFGFMELDQDYQIRFPDYTKLKKTPLWEGHKAAVVNLPASYPAPVLDGVLVAGFVAPDLARAVYPASLLAYLNSINYKVDVESQLAVSDPKNFFAELEQVLKARIQLIHELWDKEDWELFFAVFTGTDRLQHFFMDAFNNPEHPYFEHFKDYYKHLDEAVGSILARIGTGDKVTILSDHGFGVLKQEVYLNYYLQKEEFLSFGTARPEMISELDPNSKAFCLDPGRIYLNTQDRFPKARYKASDKELLESELIASLQKLEIEGVKPITKILKRSDIYHGNECLQAPDLVLESLPGYDLKGIVGSNSLSGIRQFKGMHLKDNAFLISSDPDLVLEKYDIENIGKLLKSYF
ncbi:MAG: alkaline phosphatase family protein [Candidatus Gracilibacteria bacterium]|nr:alkaline phosphatase family protein [Candidatus Gracilibacteria bacterium]